MLQRSAIKHNDHNDIASPLQQEHIIIGVKGPSPCPQVTSDVCCEQTTTELGDVENVSASEVPKAVTSLCCGQQGHRVQSCTAATDALTRHTRCHQDFYSIIHAESAREVGSIPSAVRQLLVDEHTTRLGAILQL